MRYQTRNCTVCSASRPHELRPTLTGAAWCCTECGHQEEHYSKEEMVRITSRFRVKPDPAQLNKIPTNYRVYIKYNGPDAQEMLVDIETIKTHVQLARQLPQVGKPLFVKGFQGPDGLCFTIPFGEVVRIEE